MFAPRHHATTQVKVYNLIPQPVAALEPVALVPLFASQPVPPEFEGISHSEFVRSPATVALVEKALAHISGHTAAGNYCPPRAVEQFTRGGQFDYVCLPCTSTYDASTPPWGCIVRDREGKLS